LYLFVPKKILAFCICILFVLPIVAQQNVNADTLVRAGKTIFVIGADRLNSQTIDSANKFLSLVGKAKVQQENTFFDADSIVLNQVDNSLEAFGNIHINDADSVHTYAQYLKYVGKEKKAYLSKKVRLTDGKGILTTDDLVYDVQLKIGTYTNGGKVVNGKTVLTSKEGYYYGETRDVYFKKKVVLNDPDFKIYTDTLLYNLNTEISTFVCPTKIVNGKRIITTSDGLYDVKNKKAYFNKRPFIDDSTYTFTADKAAIDDKTGLSEYAGNAVYRSKDSVSGYDLIAGNIKLNKATNTFLATQKPLLFLKQEKDTIYITADTLFSSKLSELLKTRNVHSIRPINTDSIPVLAKKDTNNNRFFEAYYHVKIFSDSLQAVCDSMFYSLEDSVFRLYKNPVAWSQENQITGDTLFLFTENKKPQQLLVYENAMSVQKVGELYFNQIKGNSITALFSDGKIDSLRAKGNAETVYYGQDEQNKFIGVNKANCDVIDMYFQRQKDRSTAQKIVLRNNLEGTAYPMRQVNHETLRLKNFQWLIQKRPKTKFDILLAE